MGSSTAIALKRAQFTQGKEKRKEKLRKSSSRDEEIRLKWGIF